MNCHICGKVHSDLAAIGDCCYDEQCRQFANNLKQIDYVKIVCRTNGVTSNFEIKVKELENYFQNFDCSNGDYAYVEGNDKYRSYRTANTPFYV